LFDPFRPARLSGPQGLMYTSTPASGWSGRRTLAGRLDSLRLQGRGSPVPDGRVSRSSAEFASHRDAGPCGP